MPAVKYYKSSIMLPLAHCTRIDAALEQVNRLLQRENSVCVFIFHAVAFEFISCLKKGLNIGFSRIVGKTLFINVTLKPKGF